MVAPGSDSEGAKQEDITNHDNHHQHERHSTPVPKQNRRNVDQQAVRDRIQYASITTLGVQPSRELPIEKVSQCRKGENGCRQRRWSAIRGQQ